MISQLDSTIQQLSRHYGPNQLTQPQFLDIISQIQPHNHLINYMDQQFFIQSYKELINQGPLTLHITLLFVSYLSEKNKEKIMEADMGFYEDVISKLMEDGIVSVEIGNFEEALRGNGGLNESLKGFIVKFFEKEEMIEVKKLRKLIYEIYDQLKGKGTLEQINSLRSSTLPVNQVTRNSSSNGNSTEYNIDTLKETTQLIEVTKEYCNQYQVLLDHLDLVLINPEDRERVQKFKEIHQRYTALQKESKQKSSDRIHSFEIQLKDKEQSALESNLRIQQLKQQIEEMDKQLMKSEKNMESLSKEVKQLQSKIIQRSKQYQSIYSTNITLKQKLKQIINQNQSLKNQLEIEINCRKSNNFQGDLDKSQELLSRLSSSNFDFELSLKEELDDANQRLNVQNERHIENISEVKEQYNLRIEELEEKIYSLQKEIQNRNMTLEEEGLKESNMDWRISKKMSEVYSYKLMRPPELSINPRLDELIKTRISTIPVDLNLQEFEEKRKNREQPRFNSIKVDLRDIYKSDYCNISEIESIQEMLHKEKEETDGEYQFHYYQKKHLLFSCDVKLLKENGDHFDFTLIVGPMKITLISGSKHTVKDQILISEIARVTLAENSMLVMIKCGRENDLLFAMNRRREFVEFIKNSASYQSLNMCVVYEPDPVKIEIRQNKKKVPLSRFKGLLCSPYYISFQYSMTVNAFIESRGVFNQSYIRECFIVINDGGIFIFEDDFITTKSIWKEKLIIYIPITPLLILGKLEEKKLKIEFDSKFKEHKETVLIFKSLVDKDDVTLRVNEHKRSAMESKVAHVAEDKKLLNYIEVNQPN